jgi:hypothetical protein
MVYSFAGESKLTDTTLVGCIFLMVRISQVRPLFFTVVPEFLSEISKILTDLMQRRSCLHEFSRFHLSIVNTGD